MLSEEYIEEEDTFDVSNLPPYYAQKLNGFLREASRQGHLTCVEVLVSKGADVNYVDKHDKTTVLQTALLNGHKNITEYLYQKANEKTRQSAHAFARDNLRKLEEGLKVFKDYNGGDETPQITITPSVVRTAEQEEAPKKKELSRSTEVKIELANLDAQEANDNLKKVEENYDELKAEYTQLHTDYNSVQVDYDNLQKKFDVFKKETEQSIEDLKQQVERLNNELATEKQQRRETEEVIDTLGEELSLRMKEINSVKHERDTERRAKEIAKKILSQDTANIPNNGTSTNVDIPEAPKTGNTRNRIDLSGMPSHPLVPNKVKQEGSKDDLEIHIEDRVKYRVRRLVKRWEERTFSPPNV